MNGEAHQDSYFFIIIILTFELSMVGYFNQRDLFPFGSRVTEPLRTPPSRLGIFKQNAWAFHFS